MRHPDTGENGLDADMCEDLVHERRELPVLVTDQVAGTATGVLQIHYQVPDGLGDPTRGRMGRGAEDADASGGVLDDGQDVLTPPVKGDGLDEVAGRQRASWGAQKVGPGRGRPLGCRINAFPLEDLPDRGRRNRDAERGELSVHPPVAPRWILPDQAQDEGTDGTDGSRAPAPFRHAGTSMTPFHQIAVPPHDGIGPDEESHATQDVTGQRCQEGGEEGSILGRKPHLSAVAESPFEDSDLVTQGENLHILVPISHLQQPQHCEGCS
ncbi:hypothetical protein ACIBO5_59050 [Nonomuraea angiospora]|uniref:hypothetical protein n=1 Tax=Nonomuraea angiospora TaxID=46172 RepID=UPI0037B07F26